MLDNRRVNEKAQEIKNLFHSCQTPEERYLKIIELGKGLKAMPAEEKIPERIVPGCQSIVYLSAKLENGKIYFNAASEALISAGLAALLLYMYSGQEPTFVIKNPPTFLSDLGIIASLSPARSNGLASMYLRMQQEALKQLTGKH